MDDAGARVGGDEVGRHDAPRRRGMPAADECGGIRCPVRPVGVERGQVAFSDEIAARKRGDGREVRREQGDEVVLTGLVRAPPLFELGRLREDRRRGERRLDREGPRRGGFHLVEEHGRSDPDRLGLLGSHRAR